MTAEFKPKWEDLLPGTILEAPDGNRWTLLEQDVHYPHGWPVKEQLGSYFWKEWYGTLKVVYYPSPANLCFG